MCPSDYTITSKAKVNAIWKFFFAQPLPRPLCSKTLILAFDENIPKHYTMYDCKHVHFYTHLHCTSNFKLAKEGSPKPFSAEQI